MICPGLTGSRAVLLLGACAVAALLLNPAGAVDRAEEARVAPTPADRDEGYVGSAACAGCHTRIYDTWSSTRHSYSVLTADEARRAGYPLPGADEGETTAIGGWQNVSYVVGGRQRIAYADRAGRVQDMSYHHRIAKWSGFPPLMISSCGPCHFTGFGAGETHAEDRAIPGRWVEHNIGCEACHGPGRRHSESLEPEEIVVDPSSRACGECHTAVGKVLPVDDLHETHDLVQVWNQDRHVTGVRFHSHNAFCSDCHSPYEGRTFPDPEDGAADRVFSESVRNITCIACHDPHAMTNIRYNRSEVYLGPPLPPGRDFYEGNDGDFTTIDFEHLDSTEQVCVSCHRGADHIDLDHADATCNDCHNSFNRNRRPETRAFHDANHRALSCRPCHQDADHLISILYGDADFLQPKNVHNLRSLPREVVARYRFKYPGLGSSRTVLLPGDWEGLMSVPEGIAGPAIPRLTEKPPAGAPELLRDLLRSERHRRPAGDDRIGTLQADLLNDPDSISRYLTLAQSHLERGEHLPARDLLEYLGSGTSPRVSRDLLFRVGSAAAAVSDPGGRAETERSEPPPDDSGARATDLWLEGLHEMMRGRYADAARALSAARRLEPADASLGFHQGLAQLGGRRYEAAIETLAGLLETRPDHVPSRVALGALYINYGRLGPARENLEAAIAVDPDHVLANYFLGRVHLRLRNMIEAAEALRTSLAGDPGELNAWFHLARAYRAGGYYGAAVEAYEEINGRRPGLYHPHYELANLYKFLSDKVGYGYLSASESAPPVGVDAGQWREHLSKLRRTSAEYGELSLSEFNRAGAVRALDSEGIRQISEIFRRAGRLVEARERLEWLRRMEPTRWLHAYRLGTILINLGKYREAIQSLEKASRLAPTQGDPYVALALAYARAGRETDAIATLERGAIYEPFNPALYTNLGAAYAGRGDYGLALEALERSLELDTFPLPRVHLTYTNLALVHLREGRRGAAVQALKNALHVYPDYPVARDLLEAVESGKSEGTPAGASSVEFIFNDLLEIFGEVATVAFDNE